MSDIVDAIHAALLAGNLALAAEMASTFAQLGEVCLWCGTPSISAVVRPGLLGSADTQLHALAGHLCVTCFGQTKIRALFYELHEFRPLVVDRTAWREAACRRHDADTEDN